MKALIATVTLMLGISLFTSGQDVDHQHRGQGYIFIGEGSLRDSGLHGITHVGGGGEVLLPGGFGVGAELGAMGRPAEGVGVLSIDPSYHFRRTSSKSKLVPFVEGGYTRTFANNEPVPPSNLFNFGGGIHYWAFERVGLRAEFRDHVYHRYGYVSGFTNHYWGLRIGLALR